MVLHSVPLAPGVIVIMAPSPHQSIVLLGVVAIHLGANQDQAGLPAVLHDT